MLAFYLAFKEIWFNKGRYLLISGIVALITTLVLFIAALAEGLGSGNREYIEKLTGELIVYQANVDLSIQASRIGRSRLNAIRRVEGVKEIGQIATASAALEQPGFEPLNVAVLGVESGLPGEPAVYEGRGLGRNRANEAILDQRVVDRLPLTVGDTITIKSIQGTREEYFELQVVGVSDGQGFSLQPSIIVPYLTWDRIRPQPTESPGNGEFIGNIVSVKLENPSEWQTVARRLESEVGDIEVVDRQTAYESTPGYLEQQSTLDTQRYFTFFIGILVVGGFFQIQTLQKVALIGMLKAIGVTSRAVGFSALVQISAVNAFGVFLGALGSLLLSLGFPPTIPIVFTGPAVISAVAALLVIGPVGGLVSVWLLLKVEPLRALGLAQ